VSILGVGSVVGFLITSAKHHDLEGRREKELSYYQTRLDTVAQYIASAKANLKTNELLQAQRDIEIAQELLKVANPPDSIPSQQVSLRAKLEDDIRLTLHATVRTQEQQKEEQQRLAEVQRIREEELRASDRKVQERTQREQNVKAEAMKAEQLKRSAQEQQQARELAIRAHVRQRQDQLVRALQSISSSIRVGISYRDFNALLRTSALEVDQFSKEFATSREAKYANLAIQYYSLSQKIWSKEIQADVDKNIQGAQYSHNMRLIYWRYAEACFTAIETLVNTGAPKKASECFGCSGKGVYACECAFRKQEGRCIHCSGDGHLGGTKDRCIYCSTTGRCFCTKYSDDKSPRKNCGDCGGKGKCKYCTDPSSREELRCPDCKGAKIHGMCKGKGTFPCELCNGSKLWP
jgi:hypothetical protein